MLSPVVLTWFAKVTALDTTKKDGNGWMAVDKTVRFHLQKYLQAWASKKPAGNENRVEAAKRIERWLGNVSEPLDLRDCNLTTMPPLRPDIEALGLPGLEGMPAELIQHIAQHLDPRDLQSLAAASPVARRALQGDRPLQNDQLVELAKFWAVQAKFKEAKVTGIIPSSPAGLFGGNGGVNDEGLVPMLGFICANMRHLAPFQQRQVVGRIVQITDQVTFGKVVRELDPDLENPSPEERRRLLEAAVKIDRHGVESGPEAEDLNAAFGALAAALPVYSAQESAAFFARIPKVWEQHVVSVELARVESFQGLVKGVSKLEDAGERRRYADDLCERANAMTGISTRFKYVRGVLTHLNEDLSRGRRAPLLTYIFGGDIDESQRAELVRPILKNPALLTPAQIDQFIESGLDAVTEEYQISVADGFTANPECLSTQQLQGVAEIILTVADIPERGRLTGKFAPKLHLLQERRAEAADIVMELLQSIDDMTVLARTVRTFVNHTEALTPQEEMNLRNQAMRIPGSVVEGLIADPDYLSDPQVLNFIILSVRDEAERARLTENFAPMLPLLEEKKRAAVADVVMDLLRLIDDLAVLARTIGAFVNQAESLTPREKVNLRAEAIRLSASVERDQILMAFA